MENESSLSTVDDQDLREPQAMLKLSEILLPLDETARHRVLAWAMMRFGPGTPQSEDELLHSRVASGPRKVSRVPNVQLPSNHSPGESISPSFRDIADLFAATNPQTQNDAVLVASYWVQVAQEQGDFEGASVNAELRYMGRHHPNITRAFTELENRRPAYVIVVRKGGRTAQARKLYRLTQPAIRAVEEMIAQGKAEEH
jgi:hypothetical protein